MIDVMLFLEEILFSAGLGGLIGIEREFDRKLKKSIPMGIRTMMLVCMLGAMLTIFNDNMILIVGFVAILILSALSYYARSKEYKDVGLTTYSAAFITYFIGILIGLQEFMPAIIIAVILTLILSLGTEFRELANVITRRELESTIIFAIIALVILPLLPNRTIDSFGIFNPFSFWLIVVLISAISFTSYILLKVVKQGMSITGLLGGLISSNATVYELASTHKTPNNDVVNAGILSITSSLATNLIMILIITRNVTLFAELLIPLLIGTALTLLAFSKKNGQQGQALTLANPFTLSSSLKTAVIIFLFTQAAYISGKFINPSLIYLTITLAALASSTAATVSIATLFSLEQIDATLMTTLFITIAIVTILEKIILIRMSGNKELLKKMIKPLLFWSAVIIGYTALIYIIPR